MSERKRNPSGGDQPISRHPLFPPIVALWCGALFGLVSIAVRPSMLEGLVLALGIDRVIPMAAPPLGTTARILMALAATGLGAIIGFLIARRLARPAAEKPVRQRATVAKADRNAEIEPAPAFAEPLPGRRRSLALSEALAQDEPEAAPSLSREPRILNVADLDPADFSATEGASAETSTPRFEPEHDQQAPSETGDPLNNRLFESYSREIRPTPAEEPQPPLPWTVGNADAETFETATPPVMASAADRIATANLDDLSPLELLERLGLAMARCREARQHTIAAPAPVARHAPAAAETAPDLRPEPLAEAAPGFTPVAQVEIVEPAPFAPPAFVPPMARLASTQAEPVAVEPEATAQAEEAAPTPEIVAPHIPAALRPVELDGFDEEECEDALPGYIPPRHIGQTPPASSHAATLSPASWGEDEDEAGHEDSEEDGEMEQGYSSLLNISRAVPSRQKAGQCLPPEEEHDDIGAEGLDTPSLMPGERLFDAPTKTDPEHTEKALRDALATLQRMSGAA